MGCLVPHFSAPGGGRGSSRSALSFFSWQERQRQTEEGNILGLQERRDEERRKIREEKARLARRAAIQVGTGLGEPCLPLAPELPGSVRRWQGLSTSSSSFHNLEFERALGTQRSPWRRRCHRAVRLCAPAKGLAAPPELVLGCFWGKGSSCHGTGHGQGWDWSQEGTGPCRVAVLPSVPSKGTSPPPPCSCSSLGCSWGEPEGLSQRQSSGRCLLA